MEVEWEMPSGKCRENTNPCIHTHPHMHAHAHAYNYVLTIRACFAASAFSARPVMTIVSRAMAFTTSLGASPSPSPSPSNPFATSSSVAGGVVVEGGAVLEVLRSGNLMETLCSCVMAWTFAPLAPRMLR